MGDRTLTEADIKAVAEALKDHSECRMGLTPDEVTTLKRLLAAFDNAAATIGKTILVALVGAGIAIATKGFWLWLASGMKQGVVK